MLDSAGMLPASRVSNDAFARPRIRWPWWLLLGIHALGAAFGFALDPLLAAVSCASAVLVLFVWYASRREALLPFALPLSFVWWNTFTLCYMNLAYVQLTDLPVLGAHDRTAWMVALINAATAVGAAMMQRPHSAYRFRPPTDLARYPQTLIITALALMGIGGALVMSGLLQARWTGATAGQPPFGAKYLADAIVALAYAFFVVAGTRITTPLWSPRNLAIGGTVALLAIGYGLSGGRGVSIFMLMLTLGGAAWAGLPRKELFIATCASTAFAIAFSMIVGAARSQTSFTTASANDRAALMSESATLLRQDIEGETPSHPAQDLVTRLFESSAVVVIEQTDRTQHFVGFQDFDRLVYLFAPLVLAPDKKPISDGREILIREFGYDLSDLTAVPIMLVADAYRRGGEIWVVAVGLIVGAVLRLLGPWTLRILGNDLGTMCLAVLLVLWINLECESVLGAIGVLTYQWLKTIALFLVMGIVIRLLVPPGRAQDPQVHLAR